jgi:hypothetical protein
VPDGWVFAAFRTLFWVTVSGVKNSLKNIQKPLTPSAESRIFRLHSGRKKSKIISSSAFLKLRAGAMGFCRLQASG